MTISLLQMEISRGVPEVNIARAERLMEGVSADLFVLPEMWSTGYATHPEIIAEDEESSKALAWMKTVAARRRCAVCGSLAVRTADGLYRNRMYFVEPDSVAFYDKHHLFSFAHEDVHYTSGNGHTIVSYCGMKFLLMVCYDLRFPVWSRWGRAGEYDAIIYVANWPAVRQQAWDMLLRARAIENRCFVVGVNRVGAELKQTFGGGSAIIDPDGNAITACQCLEGTCQAEIDAGSVKLLREEFRVLLDRDV